jgi:glycosyltransferase involved in cell wall biosynthesis
MPELRRIAFIGNSPPRQCGIATFTSHLQHAVAESEHNVDTTIVAMNDHEAHYLYPAEVFIQVNDQNVQDYVRAARILNAGDYDVVCLQHEFGIFGGDSGSHILELLMRLTMPVVTTFHTVLEKPSLSQRTIMEKIIAVSASVVVMAEKGRELLRTVYGTPLDKIRVIPHGIPDFDFVEPDQAKRKTRLEGNSVILTFGLLGPNKGIEGVIDAMPAIVQRKANAVYVVLGATHPNLVRTQGETYRESLVERAAQLGVQDNVIFLNQFVDEAVLLDYISACDVYVTPYLNQAQMTSGTLSYSFGLGKAVVSTPYWHAQELLADEHGVFVPFGDSGALAQALGDLLTNDALRLALRERAYAKSRGMVWSQAARKYLDAFAAALPPRKLKIVARVSKRLGKGADALVLPDIHKSHFLAMCDDTGLFQHAIHAIPDRDHGYCVDDNARALLLACMLNESDEEPLQDALTTRFAAFVQHAFNPDNQRFRNFMGFDRRWLEAVGSEDSHGRTLWALGTCARNDPQQARRQWAAELFAKALDVSESFTSPRAWAFTLLGLDAHCVSDQAIRLRTILGDRLLSLVITTEREGWVWFESCLAYDNARLPQALILTGMTTKTRAFTDAGLRSLRWLVAQQTAPTGHFRPVGSMSFGRKYSTPLAFDQQPLEATATISACLAARQADASEHDWMAPALQAFEWFTGNNDLSVPVVDIQTGRCRDGLHPDRVNENCGGESVLSFLMSLTEIRQLARESGDYPGIAPVKLAPQNVHRLQPATRN